MHSHHAVADMEMDSSIQDETSEHRLLGENEIRTADEFTVDGQPSATPLGHITTLLYTSHALSTWNSRVFEFGSFLFLAALFPSTLLPASIYALARSASAAALSPFLGSYIDHVDRLRVVRVSIGKPSRFASQTHPLINVYSQSAPCCCLILRRTLSFGRVRGPSH